MACFALFFDLQAARAFPGPSAVLLHSHTMEYNNNGLPPFGVSQWRTYVTPFIDLDDAGGQIASYAQAAGIATGFYLDVNHCSGVSGPFAGFPNAGDSPDCGSWNNGSYTSSVFYATSAAPNVVLSTGITGSSGSGVLQQILNPDVKLAQTLTKTYEQSVIASESMKWSATFDIALLDDAITPDEATWQTFCWGTGSFPSKQWSCSGASGGTASSPWSGTYIRTAWISGEEALVNAQPIPQLLNGLNGANASGGTVYPYPAAAQVVASAANAWGGSCEGCFYETASNHWLVANVVIDHYLNGIMKVIGAGKNAVLINDDSLDPTVRQYAMAISMLAYDPAHMWYFGAPCGANSKVAACPESALTFYQPYRTYPKTVANVTLSGGAYFREFAACYESGKLLGPCATVVNPQPYSAVSLPATKNVYTHTLSLAASPSGPPGLCNCYGDSSLISVTGPAPPNPMPALTSYVLFTDQAVLAGVGRQFRSLRSRRF